MLCRLSASLHEFGMSVRRLGLLFALPADLQALGLVRCRVLRIGLD